MSRARAARAEPTPQRVLDAALRVYAAHGHVGFNVHAIVAESGVSLGSIYHHFGSMDGVAAALYARSMSELLAHIAAALSSKRSLASGVAAIVEGYLGYARTQRPAMSFIHASAYASFLPAHAELIEASKQSMHALRDFFAVHARQGRIVKMPEALLEVLVIGPVAELVRRWLFDPRAIDLTRAQRTLPERIVASIRAPRRSQEM